MFCVDLKLTLNLKNQNQNSLQSLRTKNLDLI